MKKSIKFVVALALATCAFCVGASSAFALTMPSKSDAIFYQGHYYQAVGMKGSYLEASAYCLASGGHLITITSEGEEEVAEFLSASYGAVWIGAHRQDQYSDWTWVSGETFGYTNWASGQPDITGVSSAAAQLTKDGWVDESVTSSAAAYICEWDVATITSDNVALLELPYEYTGSAIEPQIMVQNECGDFLTEGVDYTVTYTDNINVGTATVTVTGMGYYLGTVKKTFTISSQELREDYCSLSTTEYRYTGEKRTPGVTVEDKAGKILTKNVDYTVTYPSGRTNTGTYTVKVTGIGNYSGTIKLTFTIGQETLNSSRVAIGSTTYMYRGKTITPGIVVKNSDGDTLVKGTDYTVSYSSTPIKVGTYTVYIKGKGNYKGTVTKTFRIRYYVKYVLNGGTNNSSNPTWYYGTVQLQNPTRSGYKFGGWYTSSSYKTKVTYIKSTNITLYAKWTKNSSSGSTSTASFAKRLAVLKTKLVAAGSSVKISSNGYSASISYSASSKEFTMSWYDSKYKMYMSVYIPLSGPTYLTAYMRGSSYSSYASFNHSTYARGDSLNWKGASTTVSKLGNSALSLSFYYWNMCLAKLGLSLSAIGFSGM